ncbi:MAG: cohesin domain-containing protein [Nitrososphaerota archaeon]
MAPKTKIAFIFLILLGSIVLFFLPVQASLVGNTNQGVLTLFPQSATVKVGDTFQLHIYVNTKGERAVAVAAYINYNPSHFQVVSIDGTNSVFTLEAEKTIDANQGLIKITRGKPSPGVNTENGLVATINLKAIVPVNPSQDNFTLRFVQGTINESNIVKDDGLGTDILSGVYNARYIVVPVSSGGSGNGGGGGSGTGAVTQPPLGWQAATSTVSQGFQLSGTSTVQAITPVFTKSLYLGVSDPEVSKLQEFLAKDKTIYPQGTVSGYYDKATEDAVKRFQCKYKIVCSGNAVRTGYGVVGPKTKDKLNELILEDLKVQREVMIKAIQERIRTLQLIVVKLLNLLAQILKGQGGGS